MASRVRDRRKPRDVRNFSRVPKRENRRCNVYALFVRGASDILSAELTVGLPHESDVGRHRRQLVVRDHRGSGVRSGRTDLIRLRRGRQQTWRGGLMAGASGPDVQLRELTASVQLAHLKSKTKTKAQLQTVP